MMKELFKRIEIKLSSNDIIEPAAALDAKLLQKRQKTRTASAIQSFKRSERRTCLNFLNSKLNSETGWIEHNLEDESDAFLGLFQDGVLLW